MNFRIVWVGSAAAPKQDENVEWAEQRAQLFSAAKGLIIRSQVLKPSISYDGDTGWLLQLVRSLRKCLSFTPMFCLDFTINGMLVQGKVIL